ncbi:MAG: hypothetical protein ABIH04_05200, partial [Planctomycetota bacterium]
MATLLQPRNFLRFGLQSKKPILSDLAKRDAYDGLVIPANILLYQHKATPLAIYNSDGKPFFVDPMSYLFGQPYEYFKRRVKNKGTSFKPSFDKLMQAHGLNSQTHLHIDYTQLLDTLHNRKEKMQAFVANCLELQESTAKASFAENAKGFLNEKDISRIAPKMAPEFLIPPYFLNDKDTINLNIEILNMALRTDYSEKIRPLVYVKPEDLTTDFGKALLREYASMPFRGYCLWVDNFSEYDAEESTIADYIDFVHALSGGSKKELLIMYGGYFSFVLFYFGVSTVCHGILYGE